MKVLVLPGPAQVARAAATEVLARLHARPDLALGLASGRSPRGLYRELAAAHRRRDVDLRRARFFLLDEWLGLGPRDPRSFHAELARALFAPARVPAARVAALRGDAPDPDAEARRYEETLRAAGGIDLQVLGIGRNAHLAFNEPGAPFASRTRVVTLDRGSRQAARPPRALSQGIATILEARALLLLATGAAKAPAVAAALEGELDERCPASVLRVHPDVTVILDRAAAAALRGPLYVETEPPVAALEGRALPAGRRVAVISPHPDDTSICCGGLVAAWARRSEVTSVVLGSGHRAEIPGTTRAARAALRRREARREGALLGARVRFPRQESYDAGNALFGADAGALTALLRSLGADTIVLPDPADRHPAHRVAAQLALEAARRLARERRRPVELWHYESAWRVFEREEFNTVVAVPAAAARAKLLAIRAHASQVERRRYDLAAHGLATFRAVTAAESKLSSFGAGFRLATPTCEVYRRVTLSPLTTRTTRARASVPARARPRRGPSGSPPRRRPRRARPSPARPRTGR
jgi:glucosamine-6-phosphate deaminase